jgi:hypothetical protein
MVLAFSCAATPALAQPKKGKPLREELTGDARAKYQNGAGLYQAGNFDAALGQFQEA